MSEPSAVAAHPHPLLAQLSALHHFRIYADIGIVVVVLAKSVALIPQAEAAVTVAPYGILARHGLNRDRLGTAELVLAEALNNIAEHAYAGQMPGPQGP